jgi:ribosomal protein L40E
MQYPPVKIGRNSTVRAVAVVLLTSAMILTSLMSLAETAARETPRPDLAIVSFYPDNVRPKDGDPLTLSVVVKNNADTVPVNSGAKLTLYEGKLGENEIDHWDMDGFAPDYSATFNFEYNTTGMRGTRFFYAEITGVVPWEANTTLDNNNASLEVPIYKDDPDFDLIFKNNDNQIIVGEKTRKGFMGLFDNAQIIMQQDANKQCDFKISQDQDNQFGIVLAGSASLDILGCSVTSNKHFFITVSDNARLYINGSKIVNGTIRSLGVNVSASVTVDHTTIEMGGIQVGTPTSGFSDDKIQGDFVFKGGATNVTNVAFNITPNAMAYMSNTIVMAKNISFQSKDPIVILATDNAQVDLMLIWDSGLKAQTISFDATDTAKIQIWRELSVHVSDTTNMPIKGASIEVYKENAAIPANYMDTVASDENGNLSFILLSDIIVAGNDGYGGNYEFIGKFTGDDQTKTYTTFVTYRLGMHPTLTYNSTHDHMEMVFEPIPPKICAKPYKPTGTLINGQTLSLTGCMEVSTPVTYVNSTITVIQDKEFQSAIYVDLTGQLILQNTTIKSDKRMNIYVIGGSAYLKSSVTSGAQSYIKANAVVGLSGTVEMSSVFIDANIRGKFQAFTVNTNSTIRGTWLTEANNMNVFGTNVISPDLEGTSKITGGRLSIGGGLFYINHFELASSQTSAISDADMWGNTMPAGSDPSYWQWYMPGSSLVLRSEGQCLVTNSKIHFDIFEMHCKAFNSEKSSFNKDIVYGSESTSGSLKSVTAPSIKVLGDATVRTYFIITLNVTNSLWGPISNAPVTVTRMGGSTEEIPQPTNTASDGTAQFILLREKITANNNHEYLGNYKVVITGCPEADPYEFAVGGDPSTGDQYYTVHFSNCVPAIEGLQYLSIGLNKTQIAPPNNDVSLYGNVRLTYTGGITTIPTGPVKIAVNNPSSGTALNTTTDAFGDFATAFKMVNKGLMPVDQLVVVNASFTDPADQITTYKLSQTLNITVLPENPKEIKLTSTSGYLTTKSLYKPLEKVVVTGKATYVGTGTPVPAGSVVTARILSTSDVASGVTGGDGTFTLTINSHVNPKKDTRLNVQTTVTATHPYYKKDVTSSKSDAVTFKAKPKDTGPSMFLIIIIAVVIIIVAAVAGIFLFLRMKTWGTVVECGECGAFIPENASKCPKCGTEFETEVVKCSECDAWIPALATECPKCGVEFKKAGGTAAAAAGTPPVKPPTEEQPPAQGPVAKIKK